jgi:hypothetical protein
MTKTADGCGNALFTSDFSPTSTLKAVGIMLLAGALSLQMGGQDGTRCQRLFETISERSG